MEFSIVDIMTIETRQSFLGIAYVYVQRQWGSATLAANSFKSSSSQLLSLKYSPHGPQDFKFHSAHYFRLFGPFLK